jgi:hypothetical protein
MGRPNEVLRREGANGWLLSFPFRNRRQVGFILVNQSRLSIAIGVAAFLLLAILNVG